MTGRYAFGILLALFAVVIAPAQSFPVYDATLYQGKPANLAGMKPIAIFYESSLWDHAKGDASTPDSSRVGALASQASGIAVIDIERWPLTGDQASDSIAKYKAILQEAKKDNPSLTIGFYGTVPQRNYWGALKGKNSRDYAAWQRKDDLVCSIADSADALFPSIYTFYEDQSGWQKYAIAQIEEARRCAKGKPVYAFLSPEYSGDASKGLLPPDYWRMELETVRKHADGVVIWGGYHQSWNDQAPWWIETKAFLQEVH